MCPEWEVLTVAVSGCSPGLPASEMHSLEGAAYQNSQLSSPGVCCLGWRYTHTHTHDASVATVVPIVGHVCLDGKSEAAVSEAAATVMLLLSYR